MILKKKLNYTNLKFLSYLCQIYALIKQKFPFQSLEELTAKAVPANIQYNKELAIEKPVSKYYIDNLLFIEIFPSTHPRRVKYSMDLRLS